VTYLNEAAEKVREVGELLVEQSGVEPGMEVLDVGTGTGNAALPAAKAGARVTGLDDAPELLAIARERGADEMIELDWVEGEPESLPFGDDSFDRVLSAFGHMFVPRHEAVAAELERVCRGGGALGLAAWTPDGLGGRMLEVLARHLPPPAEYSSSPTLWGDEDHLRELLGGKLECERRTIEFEAGSPEEWFDFVAESMGPFVSAREALDAQAWEALREELVALFGEANCAEPGQGCRLEQEYLLAVVRL
jgi:ubiquinone/menaquinone biosynthesis C-methylase UbiE